LTWWCAYRFISDVTGLATHVLLELHGVDPPLLDDLEVLKRALLQGVEAARCTLLGVVAHKFQPQGASVVILVAESHLSIHTWPECGYAAVDIFTCGNALPREGVKPIIEALKPRSYELREIARGFPPK